MSVAAKKQRAALEAPAPAAVVSIPSAGWRNDPALRFVRESPLFWAGLALKVVLGSLLASHYLRDLFTPFLNYFVESGFHNPWAHFQALGRPDAFPYPPVMLFILAVPRVLFHPFLASGIDTVTWLHLFVMRLPLLMCDLGALLMLLKWFPTRQARVLLFYWCSPIAIYVSYCHGQLDIIPTTLFMACLYLMHGKHFTLGLTAFAAAAAAKSHLFAALPLLLIYTFEERRIRGTLKAIAAMAAAYAVLVGPFALDPAFRSMVYGTAEQLRLYALAVPFGSNGTSLLIGPAAIFALWFRFAAYPKWNWDLFMLYLGLLFCVFVLLMPPAPAYFLWSLPFVVFFLCRIPKAHVAAYWCYVCAYLVFYLVAGQTNGVDEFRTVFPFLKGHQLGAPGANIVFTFMQTSLVGMILGMYLFGVRSNAVYSLRTGPVMIGLAGDSASGKDTFLRRVTDLLGDERVTVTAGDDYHRWPRGHAKWKEHTHLDVRGNDLYKEQEHAVALLKGGTVSRSAYDHETGKFTESRTVDPRGYLVFSGLHSLSLQSMRALYDLKVFLDPDEELRHEWKLKRDSTERKYTAEQVRETLSRRQKDREKFILPQREHADLILRYAPGETGLKLEIRASNSYDLLSLTEALSEVPSLTVEHDPFVDSSWQAIYLSGTVPAEKCLSVCTEIVPNLDEIAAKPRFAGDLEGCMQLVFLACLSQQLLLDVRKQR